MHHLSFDSQNPMVEFAGHKFSFQVFTFENVYEPESSGMNVTYEQDSCLITCSGFTWAGGQERMSGKLTAEFRLVGGIIRAKIKAEHSEQKIRCLKLTVHSVPSGKVANLRRGIREEQEFSITGDGEIFRYPNGFDGLYTPLIVLRHENNRCSWFRSLDTCVCPKTFAVLPKGESYDIELIYEQNARQFSKQLDVPEWEIGFDGEYNQIMHNQSQWIQQSYGLVDWAQRTDVPQWAKRISLILNIHCEHWTGYIFNSYEDICRQILRLADVTDMTRALIYLPGWEGRYYYQYGDFRPEPRLGGKEGFAALIETAHSVGAHVMPMFMINGANPHTEDFGIWGQSSLYTNPSGYPQIWGSCDWDSSRHYDHNCGFPMNPGAPLWQDHLVSQVLELIETYHFDGVFMDLAAVYCNDRRFDTHQGAVDIARRIREKHPNVLMSGEGWYDALSVAYPLSQPSLLPNGDCRWSDAPYAPLFDRSNRCFAHLGTGDPSRGSTGVFEFGYNFNTQSVPLRKGIIPTLTVVDGTLDKAWDAVQAVLKQSEEYAERYCGDA